MKLFEFIAWGRKNLDLIDILMSSVTRLKDAHTYVDRWAILKPLGDRLAPVLDEMFAMSAVLGDVFEGDTEPTPEMVAGAMEAFKEEIVAYEVAKGCGYSATFDLDELLNQCLLQLMWFARK